jgi:Enoyl-CoA hydratase/isomerase
MALPDFLNSDAFSALGLQPVLFVRARDWQPPAVPIQSVIIGIDEGGDLPPCDARHFDLLLTSATNPPAPWVSTKPDASARLADAIALRPLTASILCQTLRTQELLSFDAALAVESFAYSTLLGGLEFKRWLAHQPKARGLSQTDLVRIERTNDHITITLSDPCNHNAVTAALRDALYAALAAALDDPSRPTVSLQSDGKCFSIGGSLGEFGSADDLAQAHVIRTIRSCTQLVAALGDRISVCIQGACIGAGLEIIAAAETRTALKSAWFQLPELRMGLIPGAGGTVSISRAIGRHRTAWMVLSGKRISAQQALAWGLISAVIVP